MVPSSVNIDWEFYYFEINIIAKQFFYMCILKQNRGRLASKCSVSSPPSPNRKRKDSVKGIWRQDGYATEAGLALAAEARQRSSSEASNCMGGSGLRNGVEPRASPAVDSNSSTASECSEPTDDCPFSPGTEAKRARSLSPVSSAKLVDMKRRASKSVLLHNRRC